MNDKTICHGLEISKLITHHLLGEITAEEEKQLQDWLNESDNNRRLFEQFNKEKNIQLHREQIQSIAVDNAWEKVNSRLEKSFRWDFRYLWKYAAVILLLAVGGASYYWFQTNKQQPAESFAAVEILPGSSKAVLFTSDGNAIPLGKDTIISASGSQIRNSQNTLSYVSQANSSSEKKKSEVSINRLVTPKGGEYAVILPDGTRAWLNADTELEYPSTFTEDERIVHLKGEAYFDVVKNEKQPFVVKTKDMLIHVSGTAFNVMAYQDNPTVHTTLVNGKVKIDIIKDNQVVDRIALLPNMQAAYQRGDSKGTTAYVDVNRYIAWKNGVFHFEDERLEDILLPVARWYDVEFTFENEAIKNMRYTGNMKRFSSFESMLTLLRQDPEIEITKQGKNIQLSYKKNKK